MSKMSEDEISQHIQLVASEVDVVLFRNNSGVLKNEQGTPVRFGLANISKKQNENFKSSDYIGIKPTVITQEMVGQTIGVFTAVEMKEEAWDPNKKLDAHEKAQLHFINFVRKMGGLAGFANSVDSFRKIVGK